MQCLNCGSSIEKNFCSNCGQKTSVEKLNLKKELSKFFSTITNFDKGIYQNLIGLTVRPRKTVIDYLAGHRKQYFNPISYAFIMLTLLVIVSNKFHDTSLLETANKFNLSVGGKIELFEIGKTFGQIIKHYFKYLWLGLIPIFAFWHWLFSPKRTYAEHFAINSFIIGHTAFITICAYPLYNKPLFMNLILFASIFLFSMMIYYDPKRKENIFFHLFGIFMGFLTFYIVPAILIYIYFKLTGR